MNSKTIDDHHPRRCSMDDVTFCHKPGQDQLGQIDFVDECAGRILSVSTGIGKSTDQITSLRCDENTRLVNEILVCSIAASSDVGLMVGHLSNEKHFSLNLEERKKHTDLVEFELINQTRTTNHLEKRSMNHDRSSHNNLCIRLLQQIKRHRDVIDVERCSNPR